MSLLFESSPTNLSERKGVQLKTLGMIKGPIVTVRVGANQPVHLLLEDKGSNFKQGTSVWVVRPNRHLVVA